MQTKKYSLFSQQQNNFFVPPKKISGYATDFDACLFKTKGLIFLNCLVLFKNIIGKF